MSRQNLVEILKKMTKVIKPPGPPKIWEVIEKTGKDGKRVKFTIQEIPEERYDDAVEHMCKHFVADEPTCATFNGVNSPIFMEECRILWRSILDQRIAIAAFVDNPKGKPTIAGMNMLCMEYKEKGASIKDLHFQSKFEITFQVMAKLGSEVRLFERYGVDKYLYAVGLSVAPPFRGYGLGTDLLKIRDKVGREYNIQMTSTVFTSPFSVRSAQNAGFEMLLTKNFTDLVDENGKEYFPGIQKYSNTISIMAKRLY